MILGQKAYIDTKNPNIKNVPEDRRQKVYGISVIGALSVASRLDAKCNMCVLYSPNCFEITHYFCVLLWCDWFK